MVGGAGQGDQVELVCEMNQYAEGLLRALGWLNLCCPCGGQKMRQSLTPRNSDFICLGYGLYIEFVSFPADFKIPGYTTKFRSPSSIGQ